MDKNSKIFVAGGMGLVGSAIIRNLIKRGYKNITASFRSRKPHLESFDTNVNFVELDLLQCDTVDNFFKTEQPEYVYLAAAKVGGIEANNTYRADFIYENLQLQTNIIHAAYKHKVKKLLFLGSSCVYPKNSPQPMSEDCLLTSPLEYTNEPYAIAKIAGIKLCESFNLQYGTNFISVMPTNLYGFNDNFDLEKSHVLPALIRKFHIGKCIENKDEQGLRDDFNRNPVEGIDGSANIDIIMEKASKYGIVKSKDGVMVEIWGSGKPMREFLHSDDMADACNYIMENINFKDVIKGVKEIRNTHINIGTGEDLSINELAMLIKRIVGFNGEVFLNTEKPDGTPKKLLDVSKLRSLEWIHSIELDDGIKQVYTNYIS